MSATRLCREAQMHCDMAVIGGGPAGACAALTAARAGARVVLLHAEPTRRWPVIERLAPRAVHLLAALGLSNHPALCQARECPGVRSQWGAGPVHTARAILDPWGSGWLVQRTPFDAWLRAQAQAAGVQQRATRVHAITRAPQGWRIGTSEDGDLHATQLVLAVGRSRRLLRSVGSDTHCIAREVALLAQLSQVTRTWTDDDPLLLLESLHPGGSRTWSVEGENCPGRGQFLPDSQAHSPFYGSRSRRKMDRPGQFAADESKSDSLLGWGYGLPAPQGQALIAFVMPAQTLPQTPRTQTLWQQTLAASQLLRDAARGAQVRAAWAQACPVVHATRMCGPGWVVTGDAGCTHSPLSGQGLAFALESGHRAAAALIDAAGSDGPEPSAHYARWMQQATAEHLATWSMLMGPAASPAPARLKHAQT